MANPNPPVTFLFDENAPVRLARALRNELGENAWHVSEIGALGEGASDVSVFQYAGERGWCVVGGDLKVMEVPQERAAVTEYQVGVFFLNQPVRNAGFCSITRTLIRHWPEMKRFARTETKPFLYLLKQTRMQRLRRRHLGPPPEAESPPEEGDGTCVFDPEADEVSSLDDSDG